MKWGHGYILTYDLYTFKAEWSVAVLKLSHELKSLMEDLPPVDSVGKLTAG